MSQRPHRLSSIVSSAAIIALAAGGCGLVDSPPTIGPPGVGTARPSTSPLARQTLEGSAPSSPPRAMGLTATPMTWDAQLVPAGEYVHQAATIPGLGELPTLTLALVSRQGGPRALHAWSNAQDATWRPVELPVPHTRGIVALKARGTDSLSVIAGSGTHTDGTPFAFALCSTDRATWRSLELPQELAGHAIEDVALDGDRVAILASSGTHQAYVAVHDDGTWLVRQMPWVDSTRTWLSVALHERVMAVLATAAGSDAVYVASLDDETVTPHTMADDVPGSEPAAIHKVPDGWLVLGSALSNNGALVPGSWHSQDARTWAFAEINKLDGKWIEPSLVSAIESSDIEFTGSHVGPDGTLHAAITAEKGVGAIGLARDPEGTWRLETDRARLTAVGPIALTTWVRDAPGLVTLTAGQMTTFRLGDTKLVAEHTVALNSPSVRAAQLLDGTGVITADVSSVEPTSWTEQPSHQGFVVDGQHLRSTQDLPETRDVAALAIGASDAGAQVTARLLHDGESAVIETQHRSSASDSWQPGDRLEVGAAAWPPIVEHAGSTWYLAAAEQSASGQAILRLWQSTDAAAWREVDLGSKQAAVAGWSGLCDVGQGAAIALGFHGEAEMPSVTSAWRLTDGRSEKLDLGVGGTPVSVELGTCAGRGGAAWALTVDGRGIYEIDAGSGLTPAGAWPAGQRLHHIVGTAEGLVAAGQAWSPTRSSYVAYFSTDGTHWHPVLLPESDDAPGAELQVSTDGKDVVVVAMADGSPKAWRIASPWPLIAATETSAG